MHFAEHSDGKESADIQKLLDDSIAGNCEGLMVSFSGGRILISYIEES